MFPHKRHYYGNHFHVITPRNGDNLCYHDYVGTSLPASHDDVIKWKHFPRYWLFVRGIHRWPVDSPHEGQRRGALTFSLICAWTNSWANNWYADDLKNHCAYYGVTVVRLDTIRWTFSGLFIPLHVFKRNFILSLKCLKWILYWLNNHDIDDMQFGKLTVFSWTWWRHQMETFSTLLAIFAGNSPITGEFPIQRPVTRSFDVLFDLHLSKRLNKQSHPLWRHCNDIFHFVRFRENGINKIGGCHISNTFEVFFRVNVFVSLF